ncbi:DHA2 family efflux MFS transporter permease subunit [Polynucleobacter sp. UK-Mo-2m-Kol15]|uniref:DHA2 family efflux MFS transporter permease subunit n=1 Tax=Polynucleobacter sp. UK-Mo-2m-Kol15 TaxID=2576916 RepID=UPI001C0B8481|nr:DHA2 family efflux MFS transporter permease subunit [Polynucleobacter sp. UK-Mo-2m-Kol15]MBU3574967.1 DHA2 family efflux MFS transporter permease subunit [Polynucleobacter sp. UK-Mo-2m-Kol15]
MNSKNFDLVIYLVAATFFMENLDGTIIATSLPSMASDFGSSEIDVASGMTSYLLTLAVLIPVSGWFSDRFGARRIFTLAIAIFTGASILCGLSDSLSMFILARVLQGVGGALMVPVGRAVVLRGTPKEGVIRAVALITWPGLIAPVVGPAIGGFITTYASWHWIFFINVPLGLIGIFMSLSLLEQSQEIQQKPFDYFGFIFSGLALATFIYCLELSHHFERNLWLLLITLSICIISAYLAYRHLRICEYPLMDLKLLDIPSFAVSIQAGIIFRTTLSAVPFLMPLLFQLAFGMDAFTAGLMVLSIFVGNLAMKAVTSPILHRFGFKRVMIINGVLSILSIIACAFISPSMALPIILLILFLNGIFRSMQFTSINTIGFADLLGKQIGSASAITSTSMQLANALGVALASLGLVLAQNLRDPQSTVLSLADFQMSLVLIALISFTGLFSLLKLPNHAGDDIRKNSGS